MRAARAAPRIVLMCHEDDRIDAVGLAAWLASSMALAGIVLLRDPSQRTLKKIRREIRRVGWVRFLDVAAFRLYYRLLLERADAGWTRRRVTELRSEYPGDTTAAPTLVAADPNAEAVRSFLRGLRPDLMIARCKFLLAPDVYDIPRHGTFVLHPGICPEYRNAHGCFWALVNRDLTRVGMTLLRADEGIDTGAIFLQATYAFDEVRESPRIIQYRVVLENLDAIASTLVAVCQGRAAPLPATGRVSAVWGQPWLSAYWRWKWAARRALRGWRNTRDQGA